MQHRRATGREMIDVAATIGSISALLNKVGELAKKARDKELNKDIIELQGLVQQLQRELIEVVEENRKLRDEALSRPALGETEADQKLVYKESVYWTDRNGSREGPFCPTCWDDKKKLMHLNPGATRGTWSCNLCQSGFTTSEYDSRPISLRRYRGA